MQATEMKLIAKSIPADNAVAAETPNLIAEYIELVERIFAQSSPAKKKAAGARARQPGIQLIA